MVAGVITTVFLTLMLLAGLSVIRYQRSEFAIAFALTGPALVFRWILEFQHERWLLLIAALFWLALIAFMIIAIVRYVLTEQRITYDTISGAICGYLLFGLFNALLFGVFEMLHPGSLRTTNGLSLISGGQPDPVKQLIHFIYFSLVTLSGVGYGDITPVSSPVRAFAALEGITGQFYIAVLIARLVSIHASNAPSRRGDSPKEERRDKATRSARR
jgi:hypothetical protein